MNMDFPDQGATTSKEDFQSPTLILEQTSALKAFFLFSGDTCSTYN